jgi:hypothetical protein
MRNIVEVASELAHINLRQMVENELELYTTDDNGDLRYKENYQDIFNNLYDEYCSIMEDEQV